jgi:hypothetical protein
MVGERRRGEREMEQMILGLLMRREVRESIER